MSFEEVELARVKYKNKCIKVIIFSLIAAGVCLLLSYLYNLDLQFVFFVIFILTLIAAIRINGDKKAYTMAFKNFFVKKSLENIFTDLQYFPEAGIRESLIASTEMMYMGDRYHSEDYVSGKYKNIGFIQADVHIEKEYQTTDSDGHTTTSYVTIFKGRWMIFDFNKTFKANVQVCQKKFGNNKLSSFFSSTKYQKVEMESEEFNKNFIVHAQDPHDAFYILTPSIMEKIKNLSNQTTGKILLCFINNQLHVGLYDGKDSFEPGSCFKEIDVNEVMNEVANDINKITMFIDELELDNDLFKNSNV